MTTMLFAATYDGITMLRLGDEDVRDFHALPPLPEPEPEDFEAPDVIVTDIVTGRTYMLSRFSRGNGAYAEDITESWEAFLASEKPDEVDVEEPIDAFTYGAGEIPLTLYPEDLAEFNALPRLLETMPEDFEPPTVIVTDAVTEVFSPGIRTLLEEVVEAAGRAAASRQRPRSRCLGSGSARRHSRLRWRRAPICSDTSFRRPRTANPGEKTSVSRANWARYLRCYTAQL